MVGSRQSFQVVKKNNHPNMSREDFQVKICVAVGTGKVFPSCEFLFLMQFKK